jgi:DNA-binding NarL/FixJ family response regulator
VPMPHRTQMQLIKRRLVGKEGAERIRELRQISGSRSVLGELTPAERRVAALAAAAQTNREIADSLFVSVRTVETHLSRTYQKLGVRSRTELALMMHGLEGLAHL